MISSGLDAQVASSLRRNCLRQPRAAAPSLAESGSRMRPSLQCLRPGNAPRPARPPLRRGSPIRADRYLAAPPSEDRWGEGRPITQLAGAPLVAVAVARRGRRRSQTSIRVRLRPLRTSDLRVRCRDRTSVTVPVYLRMSLRSTANAVRFNEASVQTRISRETRCPSQVLPLRCQRSADILDRSPSSAASACRHRR